MIPGPEPSYVPSPAVQEFIVASLESASVVLTVCTGVLPAAHSGILKGRTATAPRGLLPMLKSTFPEVEWQDRRWVQDGKIWTSGGVSNGLDMMSAFMRQTWDGELVEMILSMVDLGSRGQDYPAV
jgi:transcriptional regulator GlxA family with amidase domain